MSNEQMSKPLLGNTTLGNKTRGSLFVVSAPAGTGKTTLVDMLVEEFPSVVASISYTTRPKRSDEVEGVHYHFISRAEFEKKIASGEFVEYVTLYGDYYGTSMLWIESRLQAGKDVILVIDTQGALLLQKKCQATYIFIVPPSLEELKRRLTARATESAEKIQQRLAIAEAELSKVQFYDYCIVNDQLQLAYEVLKSILIAEKHRVQL